MQDTFNHARGAGLMAIKATQHFFSTADLVRKIFPGVIALTLDPDEAVKAQALALARGMLDRIENGRVEADTSVSAVSSASKNASSWSWASSAVSMALTKTVLKATSGVQAGSAVGGDGSSRRKPPDHEEDEDDFEDAETGPTASPPSSKKASPTKSSRLQVQMDDDGDGDGWGGDEEDDDKSDYGDDAGGWGNDDDGGWGNDNDEWGGDDDDAALGPPPSKEKSSAQRLSVGSKREPVTKRESVTTSASTPKAPPKDMGTSKPRSGGIKLGKKKVGGGLGGKKIAKGD
jgi:hypothetical protein